MRVQRSGPKIICRHFLEKRKSISNPEFDWSSIGLTANTAKDGETSYYYKYLVNENDVIDNGFAGAFAEYDAEHNLIASYTMDVEKFIYRVYKYSFDGYYFER